MRQSQYYLKQILIFVAAMLASSCAEDLGPEQNDEREYNVVDFDRIEVHDALRVHVSFGNFFRIVASGDRRNLNDLIVRKEGQTLRILFDKSAQRNHETTVDITMPNFAGATFAGATKSTIDGFGHGERADLFLSGASVCQAILDTDEMNVVLSGASDLHLRGTAEQLVAELSGSSSLSAFSCQVMTADLTLAGASMAKVSVTESLLVRAAGASTVIYRGDPERHTDLSGASTVRKD